jgi:hypothetical protein
MHVVWARPALSGDVAHLVRAQEELRSGGERSMVVGLCGHWFACVGAGRYRPVLSRSCDTCVRAATDKGHVIGWPGEVTRPRRT